MKIIRKFEINEEGKMDPAYIGLRNKMLELKSSDIAQCSNEHTVYAAVVDMRIDNDVTTLVCVIDGTTSLYYSKGGGLLGPGQQYKNVADASLLFLNNSEQFLVESSITNDFAFPESNHHSVYLLTESGTYKYDIDTSNNSQSENIHGIYDLYQNVISQIRLSQT